MKQFVFFVCILLGLNTQAISAETDLLQKFLQEKITAKELRSYALSMGTKSVPVIIKVMKEGRFPDQNRWVATFLLAQLMGNKSAPVLAKFLKHPLWMMRLASLRTLLILKQTQYELEYVALLNDPALLVRKQAMENIEKLKLKKAASAVVSVMKHSRNPKDKDPMMVEQAARTIAALDYRPATKELFNSFEDKDLKNSYASINDSLEILSRRKSPPGSWEIKRAFWKSQLNNL